MIANLWTEAEAQAMQQAAGPDPRARELALRVLTSRLIGRDPDLVMHGGGNTSLKSTAVDVFGEEVEVPRIEPERLIRQPLADGVELRVEFASQKPHLGTLHMLGRERDERDRSERAQIRREFERQSTDAK